MKKKLYSAILASIMVIGSICGVAIPVYAKEETKIIDGNDSYDTATYLDVNGSYSDVLSDSNEVDPGFKRKIVYKFWACIRGE